MIYLLSLTTIALVILFYRKTVPQLTKVQKVFLIILRSLSIIIVLALFLNPILYLIQSELIHPEIILLNDVSDSMNLVIDDSTKTDRLRQFRDLIE